MKKVLLLVVVILLTHFCVLAQTDTSFLYFNKSWKSCNKDTAFYYATIYKDGNVWSRKDYWMKGNILQMEGSYLKKDCKTEDGLFKWYRENGTLINIKLYEKGNTNNITIYYEDGKKRATAFYKKNVQTNAIGWDENGQEIPDFVFEREAKFPGGLIGWRTYLEKNLNSNVAADANAPVGAYTVKVQFIVNKEGAIENVHAISVPEKCVQCGVEAIRVISNGPSWEPAIQYNRRVIYQALQYVSFQVAEEKKGGS
ncbi:hypothetical protein [Segetibacter aerophilus]|uniref:TonB C-terminal domain-containing protein n=1 Tax=Segetibacter aerophilus TaxID=670293 RepID=A0A512B7G2_9BACT|nr:hypothetical protein [Segetibacter aerophilus]GEO07900.1 hypothetical protein SAE01_03960 [Segetibacter aerophilus]